MITWFIILLLLNLNYSNASKAEFNLIRDLLTTYDPLVRPVIDINDKITVNLSVTLSQLIDVDEKNQVIVMNAMMSYVSYQSIKCESIDLQTSGGSTTV